MAEADEPEVLIALADADLALSYADWLDDRYQASVVETAEAAIEELEREPAFVLLDRRLPDRPGDEVLGELRSAAVGARVAMLTPRDVDLAHLDVETVAPYPETEAAFDALFESLEAASGLERAVRSYRRLARRRNQLAEQATDRALENHTEYQTLTRNLQARRDRIIARLDQLAGDGDEPPEPVATSEIAAAELSADPREGPASVLGKFRHSESGPWYWLRVGLVPFLVVLLLFGLLFAITGTWPAVVGVASDSMAPQVQPGDLIVITLPERFGPDFAEGGIVSYRAAQTHDYRSFGAYGSVIVFQPPGADGPPIIHRVHFAVEAGENWYDRANQSFLEGPSCDAIEHCPAPHAGFITKGDNNDRYDQSSGLAPPVKREWVLGVARYRLPLGDLRELSLGSAGMKPVIVGLETGADRLGWEALAAGSRRLSLSVQPRRAYY